MKQYNFSKLCIIQTLCLGLTIITSCTNPKDAFTKSMLNAAADKEITQSEMTNLDIMLSKALLKNKQGIKIGAKEIKNHDDMIIYLSEVKHCNPIFGIAPAKKIGLRNFFIFMENSKSMAGYIGKGNPDFAEPIIALFQCGSDSTTFNTAYACSKGNFDPEVKFVECTKDAFLSNITSGKFVSGVSSPLDKIISCSVDKISEESTDMVEDVFCLITDGILSGTNSEIASNREFTKNNLPILEDRIRGAVAKAKNLGLDCIVYRFETSFIGTYFDYKNGQHKVNGKRPYFIIIIGDRVNLEKIENSLQKETNFSNKKPKRFASYDVTLLKTIKRATLKRLPSQNGVAKGSFIEYTPDNVTPVAFGIQMNLNSLPEYYLNEKALRSNLVFTYRDKTSGTDVEIPTGDWLDSIESDSETKIFDFTVVIDHEYLKKMNLDGDVRLTLAGHQDEWYRDLSCDDDTIINQHECATFALNRFMGGIMKGFGYDDTSNLPDAINYKFNIKKSK